MGDWTDSIQAHTAAQAKYDKGHTKGIYIKLNLRTDMDIIRWFWEQPPKQGAIKRLIREEIARGGCRPERERCQEDRGIMGEGPLLCRESLLTKAPRNTLFQTGRGTPSS